MSIDARKIFAENLNNRLKESGITRTELAEHMGVSSSTVSDWCNGNKYPRADKLQKIAEFLGVSVAELQSEHDALEEVDLAFYGEYRSLCEDDKAILRDMVKVMRTRRARKYGEN